MSKSPVVEVVVGVDPVAPVAPVDTVNFVVEVADAPVAPAKSKNSKKGKSVKKKQEVVRGRGRPEKFSAGIVRILKAIVKREGLVKGQAFINEHGVSIGKNHYPITVSLPTLSKYVKRSTVAGKDVGKKVELRRGRPLGSTKQAA